MNALELLGGCVVSRGLWPPLTAYLNPLTGRKGQGADGRGSTAPIILALNAGN
jgi:hypothetical protein